MNDPFFDYLEPANSTDSPFSINGETDICKQYPDFPAIKLADLHPTTALEKILNKRVSAFTYTDTFIALEELTRLLRFSFGSRSDDTTHKRTYPSGGALYPIEIYVASLAVTGLTTGLYHYNPIHHHLTKLKNITKEEVHQCYPGYSSNQSVFTAPVVIILTFSRGQSSKKYGVLAYKLGLLEAGHMCQNAYLIATQQNLGVRAHTGGTKDTIHSLLNIDGTGEHYMYTITLGSPTTPV